MESKKSQEVITTDRLRLHSLSVDDADTIVSLRGNPRIYYWKTPDKPEQALKWLQDRLADPGCLTYRIDLAAQVSPSERTTIGLIGAHHLPEIGYVIHPDHWSKGYVTEALKAWIDWYWETFPNGHPVLSSTDDSPVLKAETGPGAAASRRVLQKCGFVFNGQREEQEESGPVMLDLWIHHRAK